MNSGFDPLVVNPYGFKIQTQTQQTPFYFGGSQVPVHMMTGGGMPREAVPFIQPKRPVMSIRPVRRLPKMSGSGGKQVVPSVNERGILEEVEDILDYFLEMGNDKSQSPLSRMAYNQSYRLIDGKLRQFNRVDSIGGYRGQAGLREQRLLELLNYARSFEA